MHKYHKEMTMKKLLFGLTVLSLLSSTMGADGVQVLSSSGPYAIHVESAEFSVSCSWKKRERDASDDQVEMYDCSTSLYKLLDSKYPNRFKVEAYNYKLSGSILNGDLQEERYLGYRNKKHHTKVKLKIFDLKSL